MFPAIVLPILTVLASTLAVTAAPESFLNEIVFSVPEPDGCNNQYAALGPCQKDEK